MRIWELSASKQSIVTAVCFIFQETISLTWMRKKDVKRTREGFVASIRSLRNTKLAPNNVRYAFWLAEGAAQIKKKYSVKRRWLPLVGARTLYIERRLCFFLNYGLESGFKGLPAFMGWRRHPVQATRTSFWEEAAPWLFFFCLHVLLAPLVMSGSFFHTESFCKKIACVHVRVGWQATKGTFQAVFISN